MGSTPWFGLGRLYRFHRENLLCNPIESDLNMDDIVDPDHRGRATPGPGEGVF